MNEIASVRGIFGFQKLEADLTELFEHVSLHSVSYFNDRFTGVLTSNIENLVNVCRELILSENHGISRDYNMVNDFAGIPLKIEDKPFFFVAYDDLTLKYVRDNSQLNPKFKKVEVRKTEKGISFYLTRDTEVNSLFPLRLT